MYKKLSYLLVFFVLLSGSLSASSIFPPSNFDPKESTKFTITYKVFKPSRVFGSLTSDPSSLAKNKFSDGFGFAVNSLNFEYSKEDKKGERLVGYYTFAINSPVNPYIGITYTRNTNLRDTAMKMNVDGIDGLIGVELSYLKYINPYFEFMPISTIWMFGVRIKLSAIFDKRDEDSLKKEQPKEEKLIESPSSYVVESSGNDLSNNEE